MSKGQNNMKNSYLLYSLLVLFFVSCQDETETVKINSDNSFTKTAPLSSLIKRVSQYETTADNVLDGTSCISVKLPVRLTVNSDYINVTTAADYQTVQNSKDEYNTDDDIVYFNFPITLVYPDFHEVSVASQSEWNAISSQCSSYNDFDEIACIDFVFPIAINIYDSNNQISSSISIATNNQFYNFLNDLDDGKIVGIVYPINLIKSNGQNIVVATNTQLENLIDSVIDDCTVSNPTPLDLATVLTTGSWYVSYFYHEQDDTYNYYGYNYIFYANGSCKATKASTIIDGDWDIHSENGYQRLDLHYDGSILEELEDNWKVIEFSATSIRLKEESDSGNENHYLNFTKN